MQKNTNLGPNPFGKHCHSETSCTYCAHISDLCPSPFSANRFALTLHQACAHVRLLYIRAWAHSSGLRSSPSLIACVARSIKGASPPLTSGNSPPSLGRPQTPFTRGVSPRDPLKNGLFRAHVGTTRSCGSLTSVVFFFFYHRSTGPSAGAEARRP